MVQNYIFFVLVFGKSASIPARCVIWLNSMIIWSKRMGEVVDDFYSILESNNIEIFTSQLTF